MDTTPDTRPETIEDVEDRSRDLVSLMNRAITLVTESLGAKEQLLRIEEHVPTKERIREMMDEDEHAITVLERAIREQNGHVSEIRKASGRMLGKARSVMGDIPHRARVAFAKRDLNAVMEAQPLARVNAYAEAHTLAAAAHAQWSILRATADATGARALDDAVSSCEDASDAHVKFFERRIKEVAKATWSEQPRHTLP